MNVDLPPEIIERAQTFATPGESTSDVLSRALDVLHQLSEDCRLLQEGIDAHAAGKSRPWDEFASEFLSERGLTPE